MTRQGSMMENKKWRNGRIIPAHLPFELPSSAHLLCY